MSNEKQKRINRNNRKRGGAFEKRVADYLGFEVVPYSGSNARFGYGDVRNNEWLIECKNIKLNGNKITIKQSCIAWMPAGRTDKFILMEDIDFCYLNISSDYTHTIVAKVHNTKNLIFDMSDYYIKDVRKGTIVELVFDGTSYFLMSLAKFKSIIGGDK